MMIDFALEAERDEGMAPREAIYQACLLRFRPILMTTMAALLGGAAADARLAAWAPSCAGRSGIAIVGGLIVQPGADAVHDAGDLSRVRPAGAALGHGATARRTSRRRRTACATERRAHEPLGALHPTARSRTTLLTVGIALAGAARLLAAAGLAAAAGRLPDDLGVGAAAGREPGDDGDGRRDAARARARPHRRRHRDDLVELARLDARHAAVRPRPRHRRRGARRAGGDQRRARAAAGRPAEQPDATARSTRPTRRS